MLIVTSSDDFCLLWAEGVREDHCPWGGEKEEAEKAGPPCHLSPCWCPEGEEGALPSDGGASIPYPSSGGGDVVPLHRGPSGSEGKAGIKPKTILKDPPQSGHGSIHRLSLGRWHQITKLISMTRS